MDCHSDFFSLLSLSHLNSSPSLPLDTSYSASNVDTGIAPSLNARGAYHTVPGLFESAHMAHAHGMSPVLVASRCSINDIEMAMDDQSSSDPTSMFSSSCRRASGSKRKRDSHHEQFAFGDDAEVVNGADCWADMPPGHDPLVDVDLQPEKQKVSSTV